MKNTVIKRAIVYALAMALVLTGAVPIFAEEKTFAGAEVPPETASTSVILMDAGTGTVLYEKNAREKRDPASITKILNCLVCLDRLDFEQEVTVDYQPTREGSTMKLQQGETLKIGDIVYSMMLWSANDGAEYLGHLAGGGDMDLFCSLMNEKARSLGAVDTAYVNPHGLNNEPVNNITTAYDIALVVREAMKDERFRQIVGTTEYRVPATNLSEERCLFNSNFCLWDDLTYRTAKGDETALNHYTERYRSSPYTTVSGDPAEVRQAAKENAERMARLMVRSCIGVKTGYSSTAGDCFAGYAKKGDTEIIAVVLNAPREKRAKFRDTKRLWKYAYNNFETYTAQEAEDFGFDLDVKRGALREVAVDIREDLKATVLTKEDPAETVTTEIVLKDEKPAAPIHEGDVVGELIAYNNGKEVAREDIVSLETCEKGGPLSYIGIADEDRIRFVGLLAAVLLILIILRLISRKNRKAIRQAKRRGRHRRKR